MKSKFFTAKRAKNGVMLFLRGKQIGSVYKAEGKFDAFTVSGLVETFDTFEQADFFVWTRGL